MTAVMLTYPLDVVRARLAFQFAGEDMYLGIIHTVKVMFTREGGVRGLYRGIIPTLIGMMPYAGMFLQLTSSLVKCEIFTFLFFLIVVNSY